MTWAEKFIFYVYFFVSVSYISVPHGFEAVGVPAGKGQAGAREAAQKAEADQSVHGIFYFYRLVFCECRSAANGQLLVYNKT